MVDRVGSAQVSDSLDELGLRNQTVAGSIRPLRPGMRAFGPATTVQFAPSHTIPEHDPYAEEIRFMDGIPEGALAVVASSGAVNTALWGEIFTAAAKGRGAVGAVIDGCTRDTGGVLALDVPVFSSGSHPGDVRGRQRVVSIGEPVAIGGVAIREGDWVIADDDGIAVIPIEFLEACMTEAVGRVKGETSVLEELLAGDTLRGVWDRHGLL